MGQLRRSGTYQSDVSRRIRSEIVDIREMQTERSALTPTVESKEGQGKNGQEKPNNKEKCEVQKYGHIDTPSPSIMASLSFAIEKSPSSLTEVTSGSGGTEKYCPGGKA